LTTKNIRQTGFQHPRDGLNTLDDKGEHRLNIPMDLYIKGGQRQKNLGNLKPSPCAWRIIDGTIKLLLSAESTILKD
jgi:hypothetical protein